VVTGAAGFLGAAVAHALRRRGDDVVGLDIRAAPGVSVADLCVPGDWTRAFDGADLVVHAVGAPVEFGDTDECIAVAGAAAGCVLDAAERAGVARVVALSSVAVHGDTFPDGVDESVPVRLTGDPVGDSAVTLEHRTLAAAARGLSVTVVRAGHIYGPRSGPWTLRPVAAIRAGRFVLPDGGDALLAPTFVDDVVRGTLRLSDAKDAAGEIVHLTGGAAVTEWEFFGYYAKMLDTAPPRRIRGRLARRVAHRLTPALSHLPVSYPPGSLGRRGTRGTYSIAKISRLIGWRPEVDLADGMNRTRHWLSERGLLGVQEPARRG
jgi:nucleoside-diphosphate-sugar epimerase